MSLERVVVTGLGAVSPLGPDVDSMIEGMRLGRSGISLIPELEGIEGLAPRLGGRVRGIDPKAIPRKHRRSMSNMSVFSVLAAQQALTQAGMDDEFITSGRVGVCIGSTVGSVDTMEEFFRNYLHETSIERVKSMLFFRIMGHSCASNVAQFFGIAGRTMAPTAACATGCQAVGLGYESIALGAQDAMLCGGADEFHPLSVATFDIIQAASTGYHDAPHKTPRPFDADRDGVVSSEGAGVLLLESLSSARRRDADILAEVVGFGNTADASSIANPDPAPVVRCMRAALENAGLAPEAIDYVNAHATATEQGDIAEARAVSELFGPNTPISSLKGHLGHTLAASGALELISTIRMITDGVILPTLNLDTPAPQCAGIDHVQKPRTQQIATALKNNFALGGINSSIIIRSYSG